MMLFVEAAVEALALRAHGGPLGHQAWFVPSLSPLSRSLYALYTQSEPALIYLWTFCRLEKKQAIADKAKATRARNGTTSKKRGWGSYGGSVYTRGCEYGGGGYDSDGQRYDYDGWR